MELMDYFDNDGKLTATGEFYCKSVTGRCRGVHDSRGFYTLCLPLLYPSFTFCVSDYREDCVLKSQWWVDIALQNHQTFDIHRISNSITGSVLLKLFCQTLPVHVICSLLTASFTVQWFCCSVAHISNTHLRCSFLIYVPLATTPY